MLIAETDAIEKFGILAAFVLGLTGAVVSILTYRQHRTQMKWMERDAAERAAGSRVAALVCRLVSIPGSRAGFRLRVQNTGQHAAEDVEVFGHHDTGDFKPLVSFSKIAPGGAQTHDFTNSEWQVLAGSRFAVRVSWRDGAGDHTEESEATLE